jgi:D-amino peptidase
MKLNMNIIQFIFFLAALASLSSIETLSQPRVLLYYDMEGISGINRHSQTRFGTKDYPVGQRFLTADVNAAIAGLKDGGAATIVVVDAHGSGNPKADLLLAQLDSRATFDTRSLSSEPYIDSPDSTFDAIVCIGMHARAFTEGFIAHTYSDDIAFTINGIDCSETTIIAISAARFGVPVIMVSGDDVLERDLRTQFPALEYAIVKHSKGFNDCDTIPRLEAHRRIYSAAKSAIENLSQHKPLAIGPPYEFRISFRTESQTDRAFSQGSLLRLDERTITYSSTDFAKGFHRSLDLLRLAQMSPVKFFFESLFR